MKNKLATAVLVFTLSAGIAGADCITPTKSKPSTWQKIERIIKQVKSFWF